MNSSSFIDPPVLVQNSTMTIVESWFIPLDIFMIVCCSLCIVLSIFLLLILILDKTCHTVPMMLITNSYLSALIAGCSTLSLCIFTFQNDLKQIEYQDSFCVLRGYIIYAAGAVFNNSFLLGALYRYFIVIYPNHLLFQSFRFQILIICFTWILCFVCPVVILLNGDIIYDVDNQICELPAYFCFSAIYAIICIYLFPVSSIMFIYWKLIRYVRQMSRNLVAVHTLIRAQRELKMIRRIVILITILVIICFPITIMELMEFLNHAPKYHGRISFVFIDFSGLTTIIVLFQFTDPLKEAIMKIIKWRPNRIIASVT